MFLLLSTQNSLRLERLPHLLASLTILTACVDLKRSGHAPANSLPAQGRSTIVKVQPHKEYRSIPPGFMCFNVNSVRVQSWQNDKFTTAVRSLSPQTLRIPGGEVANYWNWRRGGLVQNLGSLPQGLPPFLRGRDRNYTSSQLEDFHMGLKTTETAPLFVLNMLTSTLDSQLEMLRQAKHLGIPIQSIELGNEFYISLRNYRSIFPRPADYAQQAALWTTRIKQEFPEAKVSVVGVIDKGQSFPRQKYRRQNWNRIVLPSTLESADAATLHIYPQHGLGPAIKSSSQGYPFFSEQEIPLILGEPFRQWDILKQADGFRTVPQDKKIWITEYNLFEKIFYQNKGRQPKVMGSWAHGLYTLAMSLLFLEDSRVEKICNHMLVGNSLFSAIYANDRSFINPTDSKAKTAPFALSATGSSLRLLGQASKTATTARQLNFIGEAIMSGKQKFQYPALYGWLFSNPKNHQQAIIMNLSGRAVPIDLSRLSVQQLQFSQVSGHPRILVTGPGILTEKSGRITGDMTLPAYSVTLLSGNQEQD